MTVLVLVETVILAVLAVLVAGLLRAYATVLQRLHALDGGGSPSVGREFNLLPMAAPTADRPPNDVPARTAGFGPAHDIIGMTLDGQLASARIAGVEHDTLLLFLSSGCSSCEVFWTELAGPTPLPASTRLLVVPQSPEDESLTDLVAMAPDGVDVIMSSDAWRDYEVPGSPHVVFVNGSAGRIRGEGTGQSLRQVTDMLVRSTGDASLAGSTGDASLAGAERSTHKSHRDAEQEAAVDRELLAAGIVPGDPRLYGDDR